MNTSPPIFSIKTSLFEYKLGDSLNDIEITDIIEEGGFIHLYHRITLLGEIRGFNDIIITYCSDLKNKSSD